MRTHINTETVMIKSIFIMLTAFCKMPCHATAENNTSNLGLGVTRAFTLKTKWRWWLKTGQVWFIKYRAFWHWRFALITPCCDFELTHSVPADSNYFIIYSKLHTLKCCVKKNHTWSDKPKSSESHPVKSILYFHYSHATWNILGKASVPVILLSRETLEKHSCCDKGHQQSREWWNLLFVCKASTMNLHTLVTLTSTEKG